MLINRFIKILKRLNYNVNNKLFKNINKFFNNLSIILLNFKIIEYLFINTYNILINLFFTKLFFLLKVYYFI